MVHSNTSSAINSETGLRAPLPDGGASGLMSSQATAMPNYDPTRAYHDSNQRPLNEWAQPESAMPEPQPMPSRTSPDHRSPGSTELYIAPEVEYPTTNTADEATFTEGGYGARSWREHYPRSGGPGDAIIGTDGTVGAEVRPEQDFGLRVPRVTRWYRDLLRAGHADGYPHEPVGIMADSGHSTAGLHLHLSPLTEEQAETLYEWSQEDWMQAFVCTSIVSDGTLTPTAQVFRDNYCNLHGGFDDGRYAAVHSARGPGHYEWRLPEPMTADHFDLLIEFLDTFYNEGAEPARDMVQSLLDERDERITGVRRVDETGIADIIDGPQTTVHRSPYYETKAFYNRIQSSSEMPYIYQVYDNEYDQAYYTLRSHQNDDDESFEDPETGLRLTSGLVIDAETLSTVGMDEAQRVNNALSQRHNIQPGNITTTDATSLLLP